MAYTKDGANAQTRPVSFFFNGGPGAGTAYLNLGAAGPRVLQFPADHPEDGARAHLADNPDSWLPATDMVFIDAVGTGYSQPIDPKKAADAFYSVTKDGEAFAKAIQLWVGQNGRQASPHYLVGESYGGIRSAQVADALQQQQSLIVNGIVMISPAIQMQFLDNTNNPMASAMALPTFIASHLSQTGKLTPQAVDEAYHYALGPYLSTLANAPPKGDDAKKFYADLAARTGLPVEVITKEMGEPNPFAHDVRSREGRLYGIYDFTQSIPDPYADGIENGQSPEMTLSGFGQAFGNAYAGYLANELGYKTELTYDLLSMEVNGAWKFTSSGSQLTDQVGILRKMLALDPSCISSSPMAISTWPARSAPHAGPRTTFQSVPIAFRSTSMKAATCSTPAQPAAPHSRAMSVRSTPKRRSKTRKRRPLVQTRRASLLSRLVMFKGRASNIRPRETRPHLKRGATKLLSKTGGDPDMSDENTLMASSTYFF